MMTSGDFVKATISMHNRRAHIRWGGSRPTAATDTQVSKVLSDIAHNLDRVHYKADTEFRAAVKEYFAN